MVGHLITICYRRIYQMAFHLMTACYPTILTGGILGLSAPPPFTGRIPIVNLAVDCGNFSGGNG